MKIYGLGCGDSVGVYDDPYTEKRLEGHATVQRILWVRWVDRRRCTVRCVVRFDRARRGIERNIVMECPVAAGG